MVIVAPAASVNTAYSDNFNVVLFHFSCFTLILPVVHS